MEVIVFTKTEISTDLAPKPIGPYPQAVLLEYSSGIRILKISGQLGLDLETNDLVSPDITVQAAAALHYVDMILQAAKMTRENVASVTVYLDYFKDFKEFNQVYSHFFEGVMVKPARACVEVSKLPKDADVEIVVEATDESLFATDTDTDTLDLFKNVDPDTPAQTEALPPDSDINSEVDGTYSAMLEGEHKITDQQVEAELGGTTTDQQPEPTDNDDLDVGPKEGGC